MRMLWSDVKYAVRMWSRSPGFVAVAALTLALGIGANTTMFSIVNATLLRPLPFPEPNRLTLLWQGQVKDPNDYNIVSLPNYRDWLARNTSFADIALFDSAGRGYNLTSSGRARAGIGTARDGQLLQGAGRRAHAGPDRSCRKRSKPGAIAWSCLSYGLWTRRYGADRSLVGKTISIDSQAYTVAGVMPATFQVPVLERRAAALGSRGMDRRRSGPRLELVHRDRPAEARRDFEKASAEMDVIGRGLAAENTESNAW
jgi:putative ABC transport system permease protein